MPETYYTTRKVADWLGYKEETLRQWRSNGIGPPFIRVLGKIVRYRASDVERWMDQQVQQTNGQKKPGRPRKLQRRRIRLKD